MTIKPTTNTILDLINNEESFLVPTFNNNIGVSVLLRLLDIVPMNSGDKHVYSIVTKEAEAYFRNINEGYTASREERVPSFTTTKIVSSYIKLPMDEYHLYKNKAEFVSNKLSTHINSTLKTIGVGLYYGNEAKNPKEFNGLSTILNKKDDIIDGKSTTPKKNTSIYLIKINEGGLKLIYNPRYKNEGSIPNPTSNVIHTNEVRIINNNLVRTSPLRDHEGELDGKMQPYYSMRLDASIGLVVENPTQSSVRIGNLEIDKIKDAPGANDVNLIDLMTKARRKINASSQGYGFVMNTETIDKLDKQVKNTTNISLGTRDVMNNIVQMEGRFQGIPMYLDNNIKNTEELVS